MKIIGFIFYLLALPLHSFSQDITNKNTENKFQFAITAGGYYKYFWGERYIAPTPRNANDDFQMHQYERFTKMPAYGFEGGFLFTYKLYKNWGIGSGLVFVIRKNIYESNLDSVITYNAVPSYPYNNIRNVVKYKYSYSNIELPIMLNYKVGKINIYGGIHFPIWSFRKVAYTYLVTSNQSPYFSSNSPVSTKTFNYIQYSPIIFPSFLVSYDLRINKIYISPFLGIDVGNENSFFVHGGIIYNFKQQRNSINNKS